MSSAKPPITIPPQVEAEMTPAVRTHVQSLLDHIVALEARIEELERQTKRLTPQNSSLPPSTQHPHAKPPRKKGKSKRKQGGQPGHAKHQRPLIPTDQCDDVEVLKPSECRRCGEGLGGCDPQPLRHPSRPCSRSSRHVVGSIVTPSNSSPPPSRPASPLNRHLHCSPGCERLRPSYARAFPNSFPVPDRGRQELLTIVCAVGDVLTNGVAHLLVESTIYQTSAWCSA